MIEPSPAAQHHGHKYISLATFRRNGQEVRTPVWFAERAGKLYVMTRSDSGKYKRIRNHARVRLAPCTARGSFAGAWIDGQARILDREDEGMARQALAEKYFLMRFSWLWSKKNIFLEIIWRARRLVATSQPQVPPRPALSAVEGTTRKTKSSCQIRTNPRVLRPF